MISVTVSTTRGAKYGTGDTAVHYLLHTTRRTPPTAIVWLIVSRCLTHRALLSDNLEPEPFRTKLSCGRSLHRLGDGSSRFISDDIDLDIYQALSTRAGGEAVDTTEIR